jgi:diguanylate cyclase (GGDEF)-like protein/PAS domain S-box-containing protein
MTLGGIRAASAPAPWAVVRRDLVLLALAGFAALAAITVDVTDTSSVDASGRLLAAVFAAGAGAAIVLALLDRARRDRPRRAAMTVLAVAGGVLWGGQAVGYLLTATQPGEFDLRVEVVPLLVSLPFAAYALVLLCWPTNMTAGDRRVAAIDSALTVLALVVIWWGWVIPHWISPPEYVLWERIDQVATFGALVLTSVIAVVSRRIGSLPFSSLILLIGGLATYFISDLSAQLVTGADDTSRVTFAIAGFLVAGLLVVSFAHRPALEAETDSARRGRELLSAGVPAVLAGAASVLVVMLVSDDLGGVASWGAIAVVVLLLTSILFSRLTAFSDLRAARDEAALSLLAERTREGWFRSLIGDTSEGVLVLDAMGLVVYASPLVERDFGADLDDPRGASFAGLLDGTTVQQLRLLLAQVSIDPRNRGPFDLVVRGRADRLYEVEAMVRPITDIEFEGYVVTTRDVTDTRRLQRQLDSSQAIDPLTSLLTREGLLAEIQQAMTRHDRVDRIGVVVLDIERFSGLNDTLGHETGDEILRAVARTFERLPEEVQAAARLAGDAFGWLMVGPDLELAVGGCIETCRAELRGLILRDGRETEVEFRAGYVVVDESPDRPAEWYLEAADLALARSRASRHALLVGYHEEMRAETLRRVEAERRLRWALAEDRLEMFYQPLVSLDDGLVTGAEALMRLRDKDGRIVSPAEFIPIAEEVGLGGEVGAFALRRAFRDTARASELIGRSLSVAVNVSADQLVPAFVDQVAEALVDSGLNARRVNLEITESMLADRAPLTQQVLRALRDLGVAISLDDFGTGYSSMSYLATLPVDGLKIDRSFVSVMGTSAQGLTLARLVVQLANSLDLKTVAEGVETVEQADLLRGMGCQYGQGYLWARPLPFDAYVAMLGHPLVADLLV